MTPRKAEEDLKMPNLPEPPQVAPIVPELCHNKCGDDQKHIECHKCKGSKCRFCFDNGFFCMVGLEDRAALAREQIQMLVKAGLPKLVAEELRVHKNILCDACDKEVVGIRYNCT